MQGIETFPPSGINTPKNPETSGEAVVADRCETYGHPYDNFSDIVALKAVVSKMPDPLLQHAAEMICVKLARLLASPQHRDSWVDIAGYAQTALMIIDRREHYDAE